MCKEINPEWQMGVKRKEGYRQLLSFSALLLDKKNKVYFIYINAKVLYLSNYILLLQHSFPPITELNTKLSLRPTIKLQAQWEGGEEFKFPCQSQSLAELISHSLSPGAH